MTNPLASLDLGKSVGGAPLGVWVVGIGGAIGIVMYRRHSASAPAATQSDASAPLYPGVGDGTVGGYVDNTTAAAPNTSAITDNPSWARAAINYLIAQNYDPALSDSAVRKYILSAKLSITEYALIKAVLMKFGPPPEPLPQAPADAPETPTTPAPPVSVPGPVSAPPPPPPVAAPVPSARTYTVVAGDSLSRIAARYPDPRITWQSLFNANRNQISNPDRIYPGQVLVIA